MTMSCNADDPPNSILTSTPVAVSGSESMSAVAVFLAMLSRAGLGRPSGTRSFTRRTWLARSLTGKSTAIGVNGSPGGFTTVTLAVGVEIVVLSSISVQEIELVNPS